MSENFKKPQCLNIKALLSENKYLIPLYQRNYAWGRDEIYQLLNDIIQTEGNYYLGTLVVSKRELYKDSEIFEVIDGQQRHTTLSIINAVLKAKTHKFSIEKRNLYFEGREKSENIIDELLRDNNSFERVKILASKDQSIVNIINAVNIVEEFFKSESEIKKDLDKFANRFYSEVIIFRAELPANTNLNHYFEIMNNRGEQLEMHEILKAAFMNKIVEIELQMIFAMIWDACSEMNSHVIMNFKNNNKDLYKGDRKELFGENLDQIPTKECIRNLLKGGEDQKTLNESDVKPNNINNILGILQYHPLSDKFNQNKKDDSIEKFTSIIDFPNFLLLVLKLTKIDVRLDDKFLLTDFGYPNNLPDSMSFIENLLKCRVLFDKYVVKREGDSSEWSWSLKKICKVNNENDFDYRTTIDNEDCRRKIRMIQSMFHVSFPSNSYKNWLFEFMQFIHQNENIYDLSIFSQLESQAIMKAISDLPSNDNDLCFDNTKRFIYNFLDYILWNEYYMRFRVNDVKELNDKEKKSYFGKIEKEKAKFSNFKFVQRSSVEHLFPQSRIGEINAESNQERHRILNSFGNLCLISSNSNSAYNNDLPIQKKNDSKNKNESLKQLVMFASFNENNWNKDQIEAHYEEMIDLINRYNLIQKNDQTN